MPASIHPELKLSIVLDEESFQGDADAEIERRFTAVAPTEVVRAEKGSQRANVIEFDVGMNAVDEDAEDPLWEGALTTWLDEEFAETSALVARENDARRNNGDPVLPFSWAEVRFGAGPAIAVRMVESSIPEAAAGYVGRARTLLRAGALGADPIEVIRIPACASIAAQRQDAGAAQGGAGAGDAADAGTTAAVRAIGKEERGSSSASDIIAAVTEAAGIDDEARSGWAAADPDGENAWEGSAREAEEPTRAELDDAVAEAEAALRRGDDPADVAAEEAAVDVEESAPPASVVTDEPAQGKSSMSDGRGREDFGVDTSGESCAREGGEVPSTLDYRIWNVAYANGTSVRFDSVLGEAILD